MNLEQSVEKIFLGQSWKIKTKKIVRDLMVCFFCFVLFCLFVFCFFLYFSESFRRAMRPFLFLELVNLEKKKIKEKKKKRNWVGFLFQSFSFGANKYIVFSKKIIRWCLPLFPQTKIFSLDCFLDVIIIPISLFSRITKKIK